MYEKSSCSLDYSSPRRIALSKMEAEYVALSIAMCDLLPFKRMIQSMFTGVGIEKDQRFNIRCNVFEDKAGALALEKPELP